MKCETVFIDSPGPPPGSFDPLPRTQAVLIRLYPNPGMFTHISRGMDIIPAVFEMGSTVSRIRVSVHRGQPGSVDSPPRNPTNRILIRLPPSQVGYSSSGITGSGVDVGVAVAIPSTMTGVSNASTRWLVQLSGGSPGSEVIRQQAVKPRAKLKRPKANRI